MISTPPERNYFIIVGHNCWHVVRAPILEKTIGPVVTQNREKKAFTIFFSHGKQSNNQTIYSKICHHRIKIKKKIFFASLGRYEGFDARAEEVYADEIISIGDYVSCVAAICQLWFYRRLYPIIKRRSKIKIQLIL